MEMIMKLTIESFNTGNGNSSTIAFTILLLLYIFGYCLLRKEKTGDENE